MLKKIINTVALAAVGFLAGVGLASLERSFAQDYAHIEPTPALWTIEHENATVHLFGTFHLLPPELNWRNEQINAAFASADRVWFEADVLSQDAQARAQALVFQIGVNGQGVTLSSLLDAETQAMLADVSSGLGFPPDNLEPLQPWLAGLMLATIQMQALGFDPTAGVDAVLKGEAEAAGKTFGYFETVESQLHVFADLSLETQVEWLRLALAEMSEVESQLDTMVTAWVTGDLATLDAQVNDAMREASDEIYQAVMVDRNRAWIPQILEILEEGGTHFVAVGAGHMPGEDGVLALLEAEGLTVTRH